MNKLAQDKIVNHFYTLGVKAAVESTGMDKTAMSASATKALSRIRPMGARNIGAGALYTTLGASLGELMGGHGFAGGVAGKLLKDYNTVQAVKNLGMLDRMAVRNALAKGSTLESVSSPLLAAINPNVVPIPAGISDAVTNAAVRRRLGL